MNDLKTIIARTGGQSRSLLYHMNQCFGKIPTLKDLNKVALNEFREYLLQNVAQSSASTYIASLRAAVNRWCEDEDICKIFAKMPSVKQEKAVKVFLNEQEIERLSQTQTKTDKEMLVKMQFLIGAFCGARISDIEHLSEDNIKNNYISYVSIKTSTEVNVPCKPIVSDMVQWCSQHSDLTISLVRYNIAIRSLCERAGITENVKVYKAGKRLMGKKCDFVSSHTARISFATNLARKGVPLLDISRWMGHSDTKMTERYICQYEANVSPSAMEFFK